MRLVAPAVHDFVGVGTGLTTGAMDGLDGSTGGGRDLVAPHKPRRWQLSKGRHLAVVHALRKSIWLCGAFATQPSGPRPEGTHAPCLQNGRRPKWAQSASTAH